MVTRRERMTVDRLTKSRCDAFEWDDQRTGKQILWDAETRGFGLRVFPTGRKSFVLDYRVDGKKRLVTLGQYGPITVKQGRDLAAVKKGEVAKGVDVLQERQDARVKKQTLAEYIDQWLDVEEKEVTQKDGTKKKEYTVRGGRPAATEYTKRYDKRRLEWVASTAIGKKPLTALSLDDMKVLHRMKKDAPSEANRTLETVRRMLNDAVEDGLIPKNPAAGSWRSKKAAQKGRGHREQSRTRVLSNRELERFADAVDEVEPVYMREAIWLLLAVPVRSASELLRLKWTDVDLDRKTVMVRQPKTGELNPLPLSDTAIRILNRLPRMEGNPFVFPSPVGEGKHYTTMRKPWEQVRQAAGIPDVRLHDLRRTAGSLLADAGASTRQIGSVLGHKSEQVTEIYAVQSGEKKHELMNTLGAAVDAVRNGEDDPAALEAERDGLVARLAEVEAKLCR